MQILPSEDMEKAEWKELGLPSMFGCVLLKSGYSRRFRQEQPSWHRVSWQMRHGFCKGYQTSAVCPVASIPTGWNCNVRRPQSQPANCDFADLLRSNLAFRKLPC